MEQIIVVEVGLSDASRSIRIQQVFDAGDKLIAVSKINLTDNDSPLICTRKSSLAVHTSCDKALPVFHYIVNDTAGFVQLLPNCALVENDTDIREIEGLKELQTCSLQLSAFPGTLFGTVKSPLNPVSQKWTTRSDESDNMGRSLPIDVVRSK